jgi:ubiquinone/menaquinone biosynthesis C-methylase UbiE
LAVKRDEYLSCELPKRTQDKVVADLGCGTGSAFSYMSKAIHIYGIDASGEMLDFAKRKYSLQNNITLLQEDSTKTSLPSEIADTVLLFGVLDYVDTNSQLVEIHRILKPGGILLIMAPNKYNFFHIAVRIRDMIRSKQSKHFMSSSKLKQQLHQYGFQVISIKSRAMIFYAPKIIRPYMKPVFAFLEMLYGPFQWLFPLGANLYIEAKKK